MRYLLAISFQHVLSLGIIYFECIWFRLQLILMQIPSCSLPSCGRIWNQWDICWQYHSNMPSPLFFFYLECLLLTLQLILAQCEEVHQCTSHHVVYLHVVRSVTQDRDLFAISLPTCPLPCPFCDFECLFNTSDTILIQSLPMCYQFINANPIM